MWRFFLLASLLACARPQGRDPFALRVALWAPLGQFRPVNENGSFAEIAQPWVFERVAAFDDAGALRPRFGTAVDRVSTSRLRVSLGRQGSFSDGSPVTEADVVRSLRAGGLRTEALEPGILAVESADNRPVEALVVRAWIYREANGRFLGSGPFIVAAESERELRFVRRTATPRRVNEVRLIEYSSSREAFSHTLKGDANLILDLEPRWREFFDGVPSLRVIQGAGRGTEAVMFKTDLPRGERVALAAALASAQVRDLAYGPGRCAESQKTPTEHPPLPPGPRLDVITWGTFERLAFSVRRQLGERGGEVISATPREALSLVQAHRFDLLLAHPAMWPPSSMALSWRTGSPDNITGYSNKTLDEALDAGDWAAARDAIREDPPAAFVCTRGMLAVVDARIKNPMLGPYEILETLPDWEVAQ